MRILSILPFMILLTACSAISTKAPPAAKTATPSVLINQARALHQQEQWHEALALLNEGIKQYPEALQIAELRSEIKRDWEIQKRNKEDWILVQETRALQRKIPYLEELAAIDPNNYITKSRLLFWKNLLESKVAGLIACGSVQLHLDQPLAEACTTLAEQIKPTRESKHLLGKIQQAHAAQKRTERTQQAVQEKRDTAQQRERLLQQARAQLADDAIADSIVTLKRLLELVPEDGEGRALLEQVTRLRDERVTKLIVYGDALYRDQQIEQAVFVWESAEKLDMGRQDVAARIERATKILERLREIRENP
ncbi:hypothetical protein [Sedimenticola hydrogenitrophicus]|uniref:hypothetical protein n=1 Tax=Sedimenticola hydrogenitrophicus TaxID=2967975 RepID=UPI0021A79962|nr:hypothetical protein [Sedimenticola hydrogenitrophicus]